MTRLLLAALVCLGVVGHASGAFARIDAAPQARDSQTAIFYYPWFGTPALDGEYVHWQQGGHVPPAQIGSSYYPVRGPYSSSDPAVLAAQMREIAAAGVSTVIVSWWGRGSAEDARLPRVLRAAGVQRLEVAAHLEPYRGRTVASTGADIEYLEGLGIRDFYVWASSELPAAEWRQLNDRLADVRVFANTNLAGRAAAGGFDGLYTYDVLLFGPSLFPRLCAQARKLALLCAPSVGPGYDARRVGDRRLKPREDGRTYDRMWAAAVRSRADLVTITSYNEWHEGTQIEPARAGRRGYQTYEGDFGKRGRQAESAYLERTAYWARRFSAAHP